MRAPLSEKPSNKETIKRVKSLRTANMMVLVIRQDKARSSNNKNNNNNNEIRKTVQDKNRHNFKIFLDDLNLFSFHKYVYE